jgi:hypothetical protein
VLLPPPGGDAAVTVSPNVCAAFDYVGSCPSAKGMNDTALMKKTETKITDLITGE